MDRSQRRRGGGIRGAASGPMGRRQRRYTHRHRKRYGQSALATETAALPSLPSMKHVPSTKDLLGGASSLPFEAGSLPNAGRTNQKGHAMPSGVLHVVGSRWCVCSTTPLIVIVHCLLSSSKGLRPSAAGASGWKPGPKTSAGRGEAGGGRSHAGGGPPGLRIEARALVSSGLDGWSFGHGHAMLRPT